MVTAHNPGPLVVPIGLEVLGAHEIAFGPPTTTLIEGRKSILQEDGTLVSADPYPKTTGPSP